MKLQKTFIAAAIASTTLVGCTGVSLTDNQKTAAGAIGGAVVGGVLGHQVNDKNGRYVGAVLGALAGGAITNYMTKQQQALEQSEELNNAGITVTRVNDSTLKLNLPSAITFAVDSASLSSGVYSSLNDIVKVLNDYPKTAVHVLGFTDSDGSEAYNLELSQRRAQSVANYLASQGVVAGRLAPKGYGEAYPVASNATANGKAQNRRAEIYIRAIEEGKEQAAYNPIY